MCMKKLMFWIFAGLTMITSSCELIDVTLDNGAQGDDPPIHIDISPCEEGEDIALDSLPQAILDYLNGEFPNIEIEDATIFFDAGQELFGIRLANGMEILFDETGIVLSSGDESMEGSVAIDSLLQGILDYVNNNFPGINIDSAQVIIEFGEQFFEIDLNNDLHLFFDQIGDFVCQEIDLGDDDDGDDNDDDGDDDDGPSLEDLPDSVLQYLGSLFPMLSIEDIELEDLCGDETAIEIELEGESGDEVSVYFSLEWEYLFVATEITEEDLPQVILDSLAASYPGYSLEEDDIYQWTMSDGSIQYSVEVETDQDDHEVVLDAEGTILCSE